MSYIYITDNSGGTWYVYDVASNDWFDAWYKEDGFDLEEFKGGVVETSENPGGVAVSTPGTTSGAEALHEDPPELNKPQIADIIKILVFFIFVILVLFM